MDKRWRNKSIEGERERLGLGRGTFGGFAASIVLESERFDWEWEFSFGFDRIGVFRVWRDEGFMARREEKLPENGLRFRISKGEHAYIARQKAGMVQVI